MMRYLFPQPIYKSQLTNEWSTAKDLIMSNLDKDVEDSPMVYGSVPGYRTKDPQSFLDKIPYVKNLVDEHVQKYASYIGVSKKLKCVHSWFNVYEKNSLMATHKHLPHHIAGVFYVELGNLGGEFYFRNPGHDTDTLWLGQKYTETSFVNESQHFVNIQEGMILLFRAGLAHGVNLTGDQRRISISFNYEIEQ